MAPLNDASLALGELVEPLSHPALDLRIMQDELRARCFLIGELIAERKSRFRVEWRVQRRNRLVVTQNLAHLLDRLVEQVCNGVDGWLAPFAENAVRFKVAQRTQHDIELLDHVCWQPNRSRLIHDRALDRLPY